MVPFQVTLLPGAPAYEQVAFAARKAIVSGRLLPGEAFPSVRTLSKAMKIHANTAQRVIAQLQQEGLLEVRPGIGTVVAQPPSTSRTQRTRLLSADVEQLAVEAIKLGVSLEELQQSIAEQFRRLNSGGESRPMNVMLRTDRLAKKFGKVEALESLTLEVPEGSVFALVGPSGAGKTTAMKICLNMLRPSSGIATVLGVDSRKLAPEQLARIGYVSETRQLPEWMKVSRFLAYCKEFYPAWNDADAAEFVRAYELPLDRPLKFLSRGQRVKAALAASLAYHPSLLFLDEPFSNLDVLVRDQLIETIIGAGSETTVFLASHDLAEIESFATHVAYMDQGKVQFTEEMGALSTRFRDIEVVLETASPIPADLPATCLNAQQAGVVIRYTDSGFDPAQHETQIRRYFPTAREVNVRAMPLRAIFVALAKSAKTLRSGEGS